MKKFIRFGIRKNVQENAWKDLELLVFCQKKHFSLSKFAQKRALFIRYDGKFG